MDSAMLAEAERLANKRCRSPEHTPMANAALAVGFTVPGVVIFDGISRTIGFGFAVPLAAAIMAAICYADTQQKLSSHSRAIVDAVRYLEDLERDRSREAR